MKVSLQKQRFVNWMAKCGWYPISIEMSELRVDTGDDVDITYGFPEIRYYLTPQGSVVRVKLGEEEVVEVTVSKVGV